MSNHPESIPSIKARYFARGMLTMLIIGLIGIFVWAAQNGSSLMPEPYISQTPVNTTYDSDIGVGTVCPTGNPYADASVEKPRGC